MDLAGTPPSSRPLPLDLLGVEAGALARWQERWGVGWHSPLDTTGLLAIAKGCLDPTEHPKSAEDEPSTPWTSLELRWTSLACPVDTRRTARTGWSAPRTSLTRPPSFPTDSVSVRCWLRSDHRGKRATSNGTGSRGVGGVDTLGAQRCAGQRAALPMAPLAYLAFGQWPMRCGRVGRLPRAALARGLWLAPHRCRAPGQRCPFGPCETAGSAARSSALWPMANAGQKGQTASRPWPGVTLPFFSVGGFPPSRSDLGHTSSLCRKDGRTTLLGHSLSRRPPRWNPDAWKG